MSNQEFPNISVGDFAMDILKDMAKDPVKSLKPALKESTIQSSNVPDISNIKVNEDFVSLVTGENKKVLIKESPSPIIRESKEQKLENLVNKLSSLLVEARQLVEEISSGATTVGNIGVNTASKKSKSKANPWAICHSSVGPKKNDKFERCVKKIKSKYGIDK